jgi:hypothetical protein
MENQSPLRVSSSPKLSSSKAKFSLPVFCKQLLLVPSWTLIICGNSKSLLRQKSARFCLHGQQQPRPPNLFCLVLLFSAASPAMDTSPSPAPLIRVSKVKTFNSSIKGNQSMLDPPLSVLPAAGPTPTQPIPDSVPVDIKHLLQKYPSILRMGDVLPTPSHRVEHHIYMGSHPPFLQKPAALMIQKNSRLPKQNSSVCNLLALSGVQNHHGLPLCTWSPKKMDRGGLAVIIAVST